MERESVSVSRVETRVLIQNRCRWAWEFYAASQESSALQMRGQKLWGEPH